MHCMKAGNGPWWNTIGLPWIALLLSMPGCSGSLAEYQPGVDTARCDQATRTDCVSVSEGFISKRLSLEDEVIRLQLDLRSCRRAADRR